MKRLLFLMIMSIISCMNASESVLYHLISPEDWKEQTVVATDDPFIHLATEQQLSKITAKFWEGKDYVLLTVDPKRLTGRLVYEANPGGTAKYYHLYDGGIPIEAVLDAKIVRAEQVRAAIDFGSGTVKLQVAKVQGGKVTEKLLATYTTLSLTEDVAAHNGVISSGMQEKALEILGGFMRDAEAVSGGQNVHYAGIATAVFRKAENGLEVLDTIEEALGLRLQLLPQVEEGKLGFLTAKVLMPDVDPAHLLAWDSGNGSFQISSEELDVYQGPLGHGTVRVMLSRDVRSAPVLMGHQSGNPIFPQELAGLSVMIGEALPPIPAWLSAKLANEEMVISTFGDGESIFFLTGEALSYLDGGGRPTVIHLRDVERVVSTFIGCDDAAFDQAGLHRKTLLAAAHLASLMQHFGFRTIHFHRSIGTTPGMLIAPVLW